MQISTQHHIMINQWMFKRLQDITNIIDKFDPTPVILEREWSSPKMQAVVPVERYIF